MVHYYELDIKNHEKNKENIQINKEEEKERSNNKGVCWGGVGEYSAKEHDKRRWKVIREDVTHGH